MSRFDELRAAGLGAIAQTLEANGREAIRMKTLPMEEEDFIVGQSRIGGIPHMPEDMEWPVWQGERLYFLAQINLKELPDCEAARLLPKSGTLYFFHAGHCACGTEPADAGGFRTIFVPDGVPMTPRDPGEDRTGPFCPCAVEFSIGTEYPLDPELLESSDILKGLPPEEQEKLQDVLAGGFNMDEDCDGDDEDLEDDFDEEPRHKLFGWPDLIQGDVFEDCRSVADKVYFGDSGISEWLLLLQLDGDDDAVMWSELGNLYFCIRRDDLKARNFDRVWAVLQFY